MFLKFLSGLMLLALATGPRASVVINGTRVIFREADGEVVVQLRNQGNGPVLVQSWLDEGDANTKVESLNLPLTLVPSVARIDPLRGQAIRILRTRDSLPADRESLLWLNVLEVPPHPTQMLAEGTNLLQLSLRSRVKLFYRPKGIKSSSEEAFKQLLFVVKYGANGAPWVIVHNPSPYYVTFRSVTLRQAVDGTLLAELDGASKRMVAPFAELPMSLRWTSKTSASAGNVKVIFTVVNDQGGDTRPLLGVRLDE